MLKMNERRYAITNPVSFPSFFHNNLWPSNTAHVVHVTAWCSREGWPDTREAGRSGTQRPMGNSGRSDRLGGGRLGRRDSRCLCLLLHFLFHFHCQLHGCILFVAPQHQLPWRFEKESVNSVENGENVFGKIEKTLCDLKKRRK